MSLRVAIWEPADRTEASANTWSAKCSSHPSLGFSLAPRKAQQRSLLSGSWSPMSCGSPWAPTRMFSNAEHSEKGVLFFSITQGNQMVAGWLRPRHERSPSTQVHSDLLNSFVTRKLEKFANHFLKSWTMKANTCLPISHGLTALCPPFLSLNYSASTDTSCSQSAWNI